MEPKETVVPSEAEAVRIISIQLADAIGEQIPASIAAYLLEDKAQFKRLVSRLKRTVKHMLPALGRKEQIRKLLQDNFTSSHDSRWYANQLGINVFHFCREFDRLFGQTFTAYRNCLRITRAKEILADPTRNIRIKELAQITGYGSATHFNRSFLEIVRVSPTTFRKKSG